MGTVLITVFRKVIAKFSWLIINLLEVTEEIQSKVRARRDFERSFISRLQREYQKHTNIDPSLDDFQKKAYIVQY